MADISDLPMLHDIDADYTPQYVKLARVLRGKIESGEYQRGDTLPAADLAREHRVSVRVARSALTMLAANRYVTCPRMFSPYSVTWQAGVLWQDDDGASMRSQPANASSWEQTLRTLGADLDVSEDKNPETRADPR